MTTSILCQFILMLNLAGPATQVGRPLWIDNPDKSYPNAQFLTAVGSGDSRKDAENSAASNLSKIFESNIKSEETINARYKELMKSENQSSLESETNINKNVSVSSQQTLYNIRYAESYTDQLGRIYILAVIEREPTAAIYVKKIDENDARVSSYLDGYDKLTDPIKRYAVVNAAQVICKINDVLRQQLLIIMPGMTYEPKSGYTLDKISEMCSDARKGIPFEIHITGGNLDKVTSMINETLSDLGFINSQEGKLIIKGSTEIVHIDLNSEQKFVRWSYTLSVYDLAGNSIISLSENGREGHLNYEEAEARALRTMKEKIKSNFAKEINSYFDGMVLK
ncbi:MAG TPA: LPP20 family lipoprotein [Candidatus Kryptonia bacterium]